MVDDAESIADIIIEPSRWSFENEYGLTIQFEPYEVAAYAYGAPTITIPWDSARADTHIEQSARTWPDSYLRD